MEFRILGPLAAYARGKQLPVRGTKRQIVLGALLLASGNPVHLGRFIDAVWGDSAPHTASKQIRNAVSDLRRMFPDVVHITPLGDGYQLEAGDSQLDAAIFSDRIARARRLVEEDRTAEAVAEFRAALALWRGPALAGLDSAALQAQVASLNQQRLTVIEECIDLELARGLHKSIISELSAWVAENPLQERLIAQLMLALSRSGAPARALALYERTRQILKNELGVSPGPELQQLHHHILVSDQTATVPASLPSTARNNLPGVTSHFIGRTDELRQINDAVRNYGTAGATAPAVITIDGMAGIGKTALALHAAHQLSSAYPDAQLTVDMRAHQPGHNALDPSTALVILLYAIDQTIGQIPPTFDERSVLWRRQIANRRAVLVLDNVASSDHIAALLPGTPGCLTIVTSRRRLTGLNYTHQLSLRELPVTDSRTLFTRVLGDARPSSMPNTVDTVLRYCGYHPLAIRIAAAKLRQRPMWTVEHLATRFADPLRRLTELRSDVGDLTETFEQSYRHLPPDQQHLFRLLSHVPGPDVDLPTIAGLTQFPVDDAEHLLEALVDAHLLDPVTPGHYRVHELLHAYATYLAAKSAAHDRFSPTGAPVR